MCSMRISTISADMLPATAWQSETIVGEPQTSLISIPTMMVLWFQRLRSTWSIRPSTAMLTSFLSFISRLSTSLRGKILAHCPIRKSAQPCVLPTFEPRLKIILDARALMHALDEGLKLVKVHHVVYYAQSAWARTSIDGNPERRKQAKLEGKAPMVDRFKLMSNSVSGKIQEDQTGHCIVEIIRDREANVGKLGALVRKSVFMNCVELGYAVIVRMKKTKVDQGGSYAAQGLC